MLLLSVDKVCTVYIVPNPSLHNCNENAPGVTLLYLELFLLPFVCDIQTGHIKMFVSTSEEGELAEWLAVVPVQQYITF